MEAILPSIIFNLGTSTAEPVITTFVIIDFRVTEEVLGVTTIE